MNNKDNPQLKIFSGWYDETNKKTGRQVQTIDFMKARFKTASTRSRITPKFPQFEESIAPRLH